MDKVIEPWEALMDRTQKALEFAFNRKDGNYAVKLSNVGNPDFRQDPLRKLPETVCGWAHVDTLAEASSICRLYISFYDLGGGNWDGGQIKRASDGCQVGRVSYNGRVWALDNCEISDTVKSPTSSAVPAP